MTKGPGPSCRAGPGAKGECREGAFEYHFQLLQSQHVRANAPGSRRGHPQTRVVRSFAAELRLIPSRSPVGAACCNSVGFFPQPLNSPLGGPEGAGHWIRRLPRTPAPCEFQGSGPVALVGFAPPGDSASATSAAQDARVGSLLPSEQGTSSPPNRSLEGSMKLRGAVVRMPDGSPGLAFFPDSV